MALQPPSFFQAPSKTAQPQSKENNKLPFVEESLISHNPPCSGRFVPTSSNLSKHGPLGQQAAMLTSDLLAVEAHLQSRMRLLEEEKGSLISRVVELEKSIVQQREEKEAQLEALTAQHNQDLQQAQLEVKQLSVECDRLRGEMGSKTAQLEGELKSREEQHLKEGDELTAKVREQEARAQALTVELEEVRGSCGGEVNHLREQLAVAVAEQKKLREGLESQLRNVSDELKLSHQRVRELEGYLGGDIPDLQVEKDGRSITWVEERESLLTSIRSLKCDLHKVQSEDKLLNIRLTSIMEILSIQETTIAKQGHDPLSNGNGVGGKNAESAAALRTLLTRWREKVFVMLVQQKLSQIHDSRVRHEILRKEAELRDEIQRVEREKELLSHSLTDRNAELQLQFSKTSRAEGQLQESVEATHRLQRQLQLQNSYLSCFMGRIESVSQAQGSCATSVNQSMTKMANYEHRLSAMNARINSVKATLNYRRAVGQRSKAIPVVDCGVQTESSDAENSQAQDLTSLSRAELISEVHSLFRERSSLVRQLEESTATFERQMDALNKTYALDVSSLRRTRASSQNVRRLSSYQVKLSRREPYIISSKIMCSSKLAVAESQRNCVQKENYSLNEQLTQLKSESEALVEKEEELKSKVEELQSELREAKSTMETRVDMVVREQQQLNSEGMAEMEKLLSVARREHGKAVVQLQQLQRQLSREKDRAMEAMTLNQTRLQQQLAACRKKLEASQVERNLFLTVLRQEGIAVPVKQRVSPRRRLLSDVSDKEEEERPSTSQERDRHNESILSSEESHDQLSVTQPSQHQQQLDVPCTQTQDIREVLKDLQMLSFSLLEMETPQTTETVTDQNLIKESTT